MSTHSTAPAATNDASLDRDGAALYAAILEEERARVAAALAECGAL